MTHEQEETMDPTNRHTAVRVNLRVDRRPVG
jgi:hypothetical protein